MSWARVIILRRLGSAAVCSSQFSTSIFISWPNRLGRAGAVDVTTSSDLRFQLLILHLQIDRLPSQKRRKTTAGDIDFKIGVDDHPAYAFQTPLMKGDDLRRISDRPRPPNETHAQHPKA